MSERDRRKTINRTDKRLVDWFCWVCTLPSTPSIRRLRGMRSIPSWVINNIWRLVFPRGASWYCDGGGRREEGKSLGLRGNGRSLHFCITRTNESTQRVARSAEATDGNTRFICKFHICRRERRRSSCRVVSTASVLFRKKRRRCKSYANGYSCGRKVISVSEIYLKRDYYLYIYVERRDCSDIRLLSYLFIFK